MRAGDEEARRLPCPAVSRPQTTPSGARACGTTPIPDLILDHWLAELTPGELKVLLYLCRRTFGPAARVAELRAPAGRELPVAGVGASPSQAASLSTNRDQQTTTTNSPPSIAATRDPHPPALGCRAEGDGAGVGRISGVGGT